MISNWSAYIWGLVVVGYFFILYQFPSIPVDIIVFDALRYGGIISGIGIVIAFWLLDGSGFWRFFFLGIPAILFGTYITMRVVNSHYDDSQGTWRTERVYTKSDRWHRHRSSYQAAVNYYRDGSFRGRRYYIQILSWKNDGRDPVYLPVSQSLYNATDIDDQVLLLTRSGYLGYEWIERYEVRRR